MREYMHLILDKRVAELTLQFCKLFGAENASLIFDSTHCDWNLYYEAPANFDTVVVQFINATNGIKGKI
jgi:hypothetical protein